MRFILSPLKYLYKLYKSIIFKKKNVVISPHSYFNQQTVLEGNNRVGRASSVSNSLIGRNTYIGNNCNLSKCKVGRFCSIASNVKIIADTHPSSVFVSTSPSFYSTLLQNGQTFVNKNKFEEYLRIDGYNVIIENDVWIGTNAIIKGGIKIGNGAIIAMGAVVTKDVPPYAIVGGVPAKVIKYRFNEEQIARLQEIKWWDKSDSWLQSHADDFENIEIFIKKNSDI